MRKGFFSSLHDFVTGVGLDGTFIATLTFERIK